ncbi:asnc bacterial regulatory protein hth signature [Lucifera butyrica]|uniref:Asnc bacterial regulatory protein hth signature n=1 Tax=Lucifera butyrica TaxID=1351585 RepID=A0A498R623_9FIRM|nr:Lrp/AsnC family transcriptional regulator [Lucifera butyrica]VBB06300.1 asnc bacterial regulatory protein hth signature [Lucifera butyrica]
MDSIDLRILDILQADGRITMKELGQRVGLTSPATIERVKKLEENGVISGYKAVINIQKAGLAVRAFVMLMLTSINKSEFREYIRSQENVLECHRITGEMGYLIDLATADLAGMEKIIDEMSQFGQVRPFIVLSSPIEHKPVLLP